MTKKDKVWTWDPAGVSPELGELLRTVEEHQPVREARLPARGDGRLEFIADAPPGELVVTASAGLARIRYHRLAGAARGLGAVLAGLVRPGAALTEHCPFETLGIMLDCSRNAVMTVEHFQGWLRRLALLGYNMAMLYTEDTYELPGEPYFGYLRGRYTEGELQAIDAYAGRLGIEMIGCIQTLGHLEQILRWPAYDAMRDTSSVVLAGSDATAALIDKMVGAMSRAFRSRRLHVGMDETHDLGRGRFLDTRGYQRGYDIFNRHLRMVSEICRRHGLAPMIWSDMFFRMGNPAQSYYDPKTAIPEDVRRDIPHDAHLVYWDYYHAEEAFYTDWIARHRDLGFEPLMASGVWTWSQFSYNRELTEKSVAPCIRACRKSRLKEVFFTLWGDDGACCEFDTALAGLAYAAELSWGNEGAARRALAQRCEAATGVPYAAAMAAAGIPESGVQQFLWDDPLLGILWNDRKARSPSAWRKALRAFRAAERKLAPYARMTEPVDFAHLAALAGCLADKIEHRQALDTAYASRDRRAIRRARDLSVRMIETVDRTLTGFRRQWRRRNKPQGFETIDIRLGGLKERYAETARRIEELLDGRAAGIPELDERIVKPAGVRGRWRDLAAGTSIV